MLGTPLTLPGQLITTKEASVADFVEKICQAAWLFTHRLPAVLTDRVLLTALWTASFVYVQRGGAILPLYSGPYLVLSRLPKFFQLLVSGKTEMISMDRLKPHWGSEAVTPPQLLRHGRPLLAQPLAPGDQ
jgi:hypothetical protein